MRKEKVNVEPNNEDTRLDIVEEITQEMVIDNLTFSLVEKLQAAHVPHFSFIFKISEKYRKQREEAYTPRVVSIGPIHYGKSHLQPMEASKITYLAYFLAQSGIDLRELSEYATTMSYTVSQCYQHFNVVKAEEFAQMILLDAIFLIQLFVFKNVESESSWKERDIMHDMLLVENQLPLFFVAGLLDLWDPDHHKKQPDEDSSDQFQETSEALITDFEKMFGRSKSHREKTFLNCAFEYFKDVGITERLKFSPNCKSPGHLVHFLVMIHVPSGEKPQESSSKGRLEYNRSASELRTAGVRFNHGMGGLFEVSFDKKAGLLKIPQLTVNDTTEAFFRNLIAYEQMAFEQWAFEQIISGQSKNDVKFITSYIIFMDSLINTVEDVELLVKHEIIKNVLGENQLVADLFNTLYKEVIEDQRKFCYADICKDLEEYSKDYFHQWKSSWFKWKLILKNDYFSNPWSAVSFIAALIVIILTVIQTVCSILGL